MNAKTLVLNQDYTPLTVTPLPRAFVLVYLKKVELVRSYDVLRLHTVSRNFEAPAVIRIFKYVNVPYKGVALSRQNVFKRDNFTCQYCGTHRNLTIDHVLPKARGGNSDWRNLVTACKNCNTIKGDRLPEEAGFTLLSKPIKPNLSTFIRDFSGQAVEEWQPFLIQKGRLAG